MLGIAIAAATTGVLLATGHAGLSTGLFVLLLAPEVYAPLRAAGQRFHAAEDGAQAARRAFAFLDEADAANRPTLAPPAAASVDPATPPTLADDRTTPRPTAASHPVVLRRVTVTGSARRAPRLRPLDLELLPGLGELSACCGELVLGESGVLPVQVLQQRAA